jgi:hypothetical protein
MRVPLTNGGSPAVRAMRGNHIEGYLALWGDRDTVDCVGTWFDRNRKPDFGLAYKNNPYHFLPLRLGYEHGMDSEVGVEIIGEITELGEDDLGVWFKGELNEDSPFYNRVRGELEAGELSTSSSSGSHTAKFDAENRFDKWWLLEHTLTKYPCEGRMPTVEIRSLWGANRKDKIRMAIRRGLQRALRPKELRIVQHRITGRCYVLSPEERVGKDFILAGRL